MPLDFYAGETRPRPILAVQVAADNVQDIARWIGATEVTAYISLEDDKTIYALNRQRSGVVSVQVGYWVVKEENPEWFDKYFGYSPEQFEKKYHNLIKAEGADVDG